MHSKLIKSPTSRRPPSRESPSPRSSLYSPSHIRKPIPSPIALSPHTGLLGRLSPSHIMSPRDKVHNTDVIQHSTGTVTTPRRKFSIKWIHKDDSDVGRESPYCHDGIEEEYKDEDDTVILNASYSHSTGAPRSPVARKSQLCFALEECRKLGVMEALKVAITEQRVDLNITVDKRY